MGEPFDLSTAELIPLFEKGEIEVEGRMPYSSNATLLVTIRGVSSAGDPLETRAIYKPGEGERPLHDFPSGLFKREVAMFRLADSLAWSVIPPTIVVEGPFGQGSVQAFVNANFEEHYFTLFDDEVAVDDLKRLCLLDLIANNTDRKSGHCLLAEDGHVYGIDHGLAFHAQWKLRTVMWDFVGQPIPPELMEDIKNMLQADKSNEGGTDAMATTFAGLLDPIEIDAVRTRAKAVVGLGVFPEDDTGGHRYPWPLV